MDYQLITTDAALNQFCEQAKQQAFISVDTEFVRTRTLYPQLGLIQIFDGESLVLVDPLAIKDMSPVVNLLTNPEVVKVLHSCSEDIETFWQQLNVVPTPIYDTQFAASLVGKGTMLGYAKLVEDMLGLTLDKGESRTDWLARPLTAEQCQYAANDVLYLHKIYPQLRKQTDLQQRTDWVIDEMATLALKKQRLMPSEYAYLLFKNNWRLSRKSLYILKLLAQWRLEQARKRDMAVNFIIKESNLLDVAKFLPRNKTDLFGLPTISVHEARRNGEEMLNMVAKVNVTPPELYPEKIERLVDFPAYKKVSAEIKSECASVANRLALPIELFASKKMINQVLKWVWFKLDDDRLSNKKPDLLYGWRAQYIRPQIEKIVGKIED